ncbi:hypothetical protein GPECTOR_51g708 [Gonium pectorale]|uniref:Uncharacterized protein n=1 Tax=Gonium pectorale TaxID=33097 RepID=A0A150G799_GONPE|nr:hypothetical protein GPECTOR_51g708 [Gonium pectorale]|eukprot:KXZ45722.1 hypothetical protein GPECTOR_51g708 [Gonium pectorale]
MAHGFDLPPLQRMWERWRELDDGTKRESLAAAAGSPTPDWAAKVEWLEAQGCPRGANAAAAVASRPDAVTRLSWLRGRACPVGAGAVMAASNAVNVVVVHYLLAETLVEPAGVAQMSSLDEYEHWTCIAHSAASHGQLEVLQALHAADSPLIARFCASGAARNGLLHVLAWLSETYRNRQGER